jgi:hypothetical protein
MAHSQDAVRRPGPRRRHKGSLKNDYRFISERALEACGTYEVESISLVAVSQAPGSTTKATSSR